MFNSRIHHLVPFRLVSHLGLLVILLLSVTASPGIKTSCNAPPVTVGQPGRVTCRFSGSIQNEDEFSVHRYNLTISTPGIKDRETVLSCYKDHNAEFGCNIEEGYKYQYSSKHTTMISVEIISADIEHVGRYECATMEQHPWDIHSCNFTVKDGTPTPPTFPSEVTTKDLHEGNATTGKNTTEKGGGANRVVIGAVVGALVGALAAIIVIVMYRKRLWLQQKCTAGRYMEPTVAVKETEHSTKKDTEAVGSQMLKRQEDDEKETTPAAELIRNAEAETET